MHRRTLEARDNYKTSKENILNEQPDKLWPKKRVGCRNFRRRRIKLQDKSWEFLYDWNRSEIVIWHAMILMFVDSEGGSGGKC